jgi:ketosteroid isomerase-like protein
VDDFHAALTAGDIPAALMRLADDAAVFESGGVERGKAEYAAHHAAADAAFAKAVPSRIVRRTGQAFGDTAWVLTEAGRRACTTIGKSIGSRSRRWCSDGRVPPGASSISIGRRPPPALPPNQHLRRSSHA